MKTIDKSSRRSRELKVVVKDKLNWAIVPIEYDTDKNTTVRNPITMREYLLECNQMVDLPIETVSLYNELAKVFKVQKPYILEQDNKNGEYHIKTINEDGTKKYIYSSRDKDRLQMKLMEFLIKSNAMGNLSIDDSLKELIGEMK